MKTKLKLSNIGATIAKVLLALFILSPAYILFVYAMKTKSEIMFTGLAWPEVFRLDNFYKAIEQSNILLALRNTTVAALCSIPITVLCAAMAAYIITRCNRKFYQRTYYMFLSYLVLPFQVIMLPLYMVLDRLNLMNTLHGYSFAMIGLQMSFTVFIISGFVKTVPIELEEAAAIDGAGRYRCFFTIILPLMRPILITVAVLDTLTIWNDLPIAQIILQDNDLKTLTLAQYSFISQYTSNLGLAFAAFIISITPIIIIYFFTQKFIIGGITAGAVKG